jgi:hypothetical protein
MTLHLANADGAVWDGSKRAWLVSRVESEIALYPRMHSSVGMHRAELDFELVGVTLGPDDLS